MLSTRPMPDGSIPIYSIDSDSRPMPMTWFQPELFAVTPRFAYVAIR